MFPPGAQELTLPKRPSGDAAPVGQSPLWGKRVLMLDDSSDVLDLYRPHLQRLTGIEPVQLHYTNQGLAELVDSIARQRPHVALIDWNLDFERAHRVNGGLVAAQLASRCPETAVILFSSVQIDDVELRRCGASASIKKSGIEPLHSLAMVAELFRK